MTTPNQQPPGGKHVPSRAPGAGPRDLSGSLARHRQGGDARETIPPGGYPETAGTNPDAPEDRQVSDSGGDVVPGLGPYSAVTDRMTAPARNMSTGSY